MAAVVVTAAIWSCPIVAVVAAEPAVCTGLKAEGPPMTYRDPRWGITMTFPAVFALVPGSVPEDGGSASFLAAGGYHHHVAVNIWGTDGAPPAVEGSLGLRWFRLSLPDPEALLELERRLDAASVQHRREGSALRFKDPAGHTLIAAAESGQANP